MAVTDDGHIITRNLTLNDEGPGGTARDYYRCYCSVHEQAAPTESKFSGNDGFCDGDGTADRMDVFTAVGSFIDNSLTLWVAEQQGSQVHRLDWTGSGFQPVTLYLTDEVGAKVVLEGYPSVVSKGPRSSPLFS